MVIINDLKATLKEEFEMKDISDLSYFLGIQVNHDKSWKLIHIHQTGQCIGYGGQEWLQQCTGCPLHQSGEVEEELDQGIG